MRILGIDPGLRRCGWGVIAQNGTKLSYVDCGVVTPDPNAALSDRLRTLYDALGTVLVRHSPTHAGVEDAFVHKNAMSALKLGHARAAALLAISEFGIEAQEYAARLVKKSVTGTGSADKDQVASMVSMILPGCRATADAADALGVAICCAHHVGGNAGRIPA